MIQRCVLVCYLEGGTGAVNAGDLSAMGGEMESEASLIAEDVERFSVGVVGGGVIVLALVEEGAGLLAMESVVMKLDAVHA